jgi:hypothetical protein
MSTSPVLRTATSLAITVAFAYATCALFFWLWPGSAMSLMNALFHGVDFGKLQTAAAFDFRGFGAALLVVTAWAFILGALFGWLHGRHRLAGSA